ncbi:MULTISPECIES: hypothetical protein [unclassified Variovorax]|uniref:hypothetical protein n=1 Tax=unclassified Variovorax TaxID=663243 RepID=UPI003F45BD75
MKAAKALDLAPRRASAVPLEYLPRYAGIRVDRQTWTLSIRKKFFGHGENPWVKKKLGDAWLPPTALTRFRPLRLKERPHLFWTVIAVLDGYLMRTADCKSTHFSASSIVNVTLKAIEFAWLNGFYKLQDVPATSWAMLAEELVQGGWSLALKIEARTVVVIHEMRAELVDLHVSRSPSESPRPSNRFLDRLATNIGCAGRPAVKSLIEQAQSRPQLANSDRLADYEPLPTSKIGWALLQETLTYLNLLASAPSPWGILILPVADPYGYARKHGRDGNRTANLSPSTVATLLMHSYKWVVDRGPAVVRLVREMESRLSAHVRARTDSALEFSMDQKPAGASDCDPRRAVRGRLSGPDGIALIAKLLCSLDETREVEQMIGQPIVRPVASKVEGKTSLHRVLTQLYSACFVIVGIMNARRRDEIIHRAIGLRSGSMSLVDKQLNLYQCAFYIEKSEQDYVDFFINDITRVALGLLEEISAIAWRWNALVTGTALPEPAARMLFVMPDFTGASDSGVFWFDFGINLPYRNPQFLRDAWCVDETKDAFDATRPKITAHMFRRAYGLIFHYRYENATLMALAQKYGHINPTISLHYVTDDARSALGKSAAALWSAPSMVVSKARDLKRREIQGEIDIVGREKLREFVADVVLGAKTFSGGFSKLVSRFHRKLGAHLDYSSLDTDAQIKELGDALLARGHMPLPFPHATCMAGAQHKLAACAKKDASLAREMASAAFCSKCAYSATSSAHLRWLEIDERDMTLRVENDVQASLPEKSLHHLRVAGELKNLRRVIQLHKARLGLP